MKKVFEAINPTYSSFYRIYKTAVRKYRIQMEHRKGASSGDCSLSVLTSEGVWTRITYAWELAFAYENLYFTDDAKAQAEKKQMFEDWDGESKILNASTKLVNICLKAEEWNEKYRHRSEMYRALA
jgi:hypothetical protein